MYLKIGNEIKLLIILLVLVCEFSFAQKNNNSNLAFRDTTSREVIQEKIEIARNQFSSDSIIPVELMEEILAVSIGQNYLKETADAYFLLSEMNKASEQCEHAIKNVKKSQEIYLSLNDNDGYFNTVLLVSDCYITQKNYELAEQQYTTAILRFSTSDLQKKLALKLELGRLYLINNYSKAKPIFEEILPQALNNKFYAIASETEIELGNIALKEQNYSRAESFFKSAKEHATLSENPVLVYNANNQLTSCFVSNNDMTNANLTLNDATTYMWTTGDTNLILSTNLAVADYNVTIGNYTNAIDVLNSTYILSGATSNLVFKPAQLRNYILFMP